MDKRKKPPVDTSALDNDVLEILASAHEPAAIPAEQHERMRSRVMQMIHQETASKAPASSNFSTLRPNEGEWVKAMPGAYFKIVHDHGNGLDGLLSYLIKLEPGFSMQGHNHPFDEECLMLEGDLTLGDITLHKGDFHFAPAGGMHGNVSTQQGCMAYIRGALPV